MKRFNFEEMSRGDFLRLAGLGAGAVMLGDYGIAHATDLGRHLVETPSGSGFTLNPAPAHIQLGTQSVSTIVYNDVLPGPLIRVKKGERMRATVTNRLSSSTSVHWHGLPVPNKMDGVPGVTQAPIKPGDTFVYDWTAPVSGTYWYHSHSGIQNDRGLYGPLIIDPIHESLSYDREYTLVIDDWIDGLQKWSGSVSDFLFECHVIPESAATSRPRLAGGIPPNQPDRYPLFLINGEPPAAPATFDVQRGDVVRLRLINASAASVVKVAIDGHRMRVTHADGQRVEPVDVDAVEIGMAERYDVLVQANNPGVWQIAVAVIGQGVRTRGILKYRGSKRAAPPATFKPASLKGKHLDYQMLRAASDVEYSVPAGKPDLVIPIGLNARFGSFWMTFNGQVLNSLQPFHIPRNRHIRFVISNSGSTEIHPIHLHGNAFQIQTRSGNGPFKDTIRVGAGQSYAVDGYSNNPGIWLLHCHNQYHMLRGMMQLLRVS